MNVVMNLFDELQARLDALRGLFPTLEAADEISSAVALLNDETLCDLTDLVAHTMRCLLYTSRCV